MTTCSSSGVCRNVCRSLLSGQVLIVQTTESGWDFRIFPLSEKALLKATEEVVTASSQHIVAVLKTEMKSRRLRNFAPVVAPFDLSLQQRKYGIGRPRFTIVHGSAALHS